MPCCTLFRAAFCRNGSCLLMNGISPVPFSGRDDLAAYAWRFVIALVGSGNHGSALRQPVRAPYRPGPYPAGPLALRRPGRAPSLLFPFAYPQLSGPPRASRGLCACDHTGRHQGECPAGGRPASGPDGATVRPPHRLPARAWRSGALLAATGLQSKANREAQVQALPSKSGYDALRSVVASDSDRIAESRGRHP